MVVRPDMVAVSPPERVRYRWAEARRRVKTGTGMKGHMARGFWTGLLHGGAVSIAALAALSLAAPVPQAERDPVAEAVDLPVGSEFGRGGDVVPRVPAPLAPGRPDGAEAPAVAAPASEPAPVAVTAAEPRPRPAGEGDGPVQGAPAAGEDAPRLDRPAALPQPAAPAAPGRTVADAPDAVPSIPPDRPAAPPPATPALSAPALDLSLPPDLSDLQGLSRD